MAKVVRLVQTDGVLQGRVGLDVQTRRLQLARQFDGGYELAKMAVDETVRGRGIGKRLMTAAVELARELKAPRLYIETNSSLKNAIGLYEAHGFRHMAAQPTAYARCDVWMELTLSPDRAPTRA